MEIQDEELRKRAWEVLNEALEGIEFPEYVKIQKKDDGTFSFLLTLYYDAVGSAVIYYKPSIEVVSSLLTLTTKHIPEELDFSMELGEKLDSSFALLFSYVYLKNFHHEFSEVFIRLNEIPFLIPVMAMAESLDGENEIKKSRIEQTKKELEDLLETRKQQTKNRILNEIESAEMPRQPAKHLIAHYYEFLLPQWENAKDCYKKNKNFKNWEQMVAIGFNDLPKDLISRLGDMDSYIAMPSSISLEHAARFCGIKPNSLGLRALQKYLQHSRKWMAKVGSENVEIEVEKYVKKVIREVATDIEIAYLNDDGKEFPFEKESYFHQVIAETLGDKIKTVIKKLRDKNPNDELEDNNQVH